MSEELARELKRRKKEREAEWKKILAYYMMEKLKVERRQEAAMRAFAERYTAIITAELVVKEKKLAALFRKEPGRLSAVEILKKMCPNEEKNSPFRKLYDKISKEPISEQEAEKAIAEVIAEAPPMILESAKAERERKEKWQQEQIRQREADPVAAKLHILEEDEEALRYAKKMRHRLSCLRKLMPQELFQNLCNGLAREGHAVNVNELEIPEEEPQHMTYEEYTARKKAQMQMHDGKFVNADNVYTSAAYMLAAYEQKDLPVFNAAVADERARQLFGTKAFRVYLDSHPGSLVAAAQGAFMDITHEGIVKLEAELQKRDAVLNTVSRNLRQSATGKTQRFYKMLNKLERFAGSPVEPSEAERKDLLASMGEYILKDCAPDSKEYDEACFKDAMCAVKALIPAESFGKVLDQVNKGRVSKVEAGDFAEPAPRAEEKQPAAQRADAMLAPELEVFMG